MLDEIVSREREFAHLLEIMTWADSAVEMRSGVHEAEADRASVQRARDFVLRLQKSGE